MNKAKATKRFWIGTALWFPGLVILVLEGLLVSPTGRSLFANIIFIVSLVLMLGGGLILGLAWARLNELDRWPHRATFSTCDNGC